jgi:hypothetical protein
MKVTILLPSIMLAAIATAIHSFSISSIPRPLQQIRIVSPRFMTAAADENEAATTNAKVMALRATAQKARDQASRLRQVNDE